MTTLWISILRMTTITPTVIARHSPQRQANEAIWLLMMKEHNYYVYIMTNFKNSVLYTGVCNNLERRVYEHKTHKYPDSFTAKYKVNKLVYFEFYSNIDEAITREKQIKSGSRESKMRLIEKENKEWNDVSNGWKG